MTEVICAALTGFCAIVCAAIASQASKREKREKEEQERVNRRAEQRAKEGRQLAMIDANCKLTVGVAMALKRGHCNGEVEQGLAAIQKTQRDYEQFLEGIGIDHITR